METINVVFRIALDLREIFVFFSLFVCLFFFFSFLLYLYTHSAFCNSNNLNICIAGGVVKKKKNRPEKNGEIRGAVTEYVTFAESRR